MLRLLTMTIAMFIVCRATNGLDLGRIGISKAQRIKPVLRLEIAERSGVSYKMPKKAGQCGISNSIPDFCSCNLDIRSREPYKTLCKEICDADAGCMGYDAYGDGEDFDCTVYPDSSSPCPDECFFNKGIGVGLLENLLYHSGTSMVFDTYYSGCHIKLVTCESADDCSVAFDGLLDSAECIDGFCDPSTMSPDEGDDDQNDDDDENDDDDDDSDDECAKYGGIIDEGETTCCATSCGTCGGSGCKSRDGGHTNCCIAQIRRQGLVCGTDHNAPCYL